MAPLPPRSHRGHHKTTCSRCRWPIRHPSRLLSPRTFRFRADVRARIDLHHVLARLARAIHACVASFPGTRLEFDTLRACLPPGLHVQQEHTAWQMWLFLSACLRGGLRAVDVAGLAERVGAEAAGWSPAARRLWGFLARLGYFEDEGRLGGWEERCWNQGRGFTGVQLEVEMYGLHLADADEYPNLFADDEGDGRDHGVHGGGLRRWETGEKEARRSKGWEYRGAWTEGGSPHRAALGIERDSDGNESDGAREFCGTHDGAEMKREIEEICKGVQFNLSS